MCGSCAHLCLFCVPWCPFQAREAAARVRSALDERAAEEAKQRAEALASPCPTLPIVCTPALPCFVMHPATPAPRPR